MSRSKCIYLEVGLVTLSLVLVTSLLNLLQNISFIGKVYALVFAVLFLYVPVVVLQKRKRPIDFLDRNFKSYLKSFLTFFITSLIVFPLFALATHAWMTVVYSAEGPVYRMFPDFWHFFAFQFIMIALPEEFFFRGYVQSSLNTVLPKKWKILGVKLGWSWIITALVFAFAHSLVVLRWWHFAIFFPALLFGYLRERTGSITAPVLFHGASNVIMNVIANMYI